MAVQEIHGAAGEGVPPNVIIRVTGDEDDGHQGTIESARRRNSMPSIPGIRTSAIRQLASASAPDCTNCCALRTRASRIRLIHHALDRLSNSTIVVHRNYDLFLHSRHHERLFMLRSMIPAGRSTDYDTFI